MALPPLLQEHVKELESQGYTVEITDGPEICIVFKDYPVPSDIWDRDKIDLLVITHPTYPNAKMDMFWVDPALSLKNGNTVKAISPDTKCGKTWQRFSWHVNSWNPAHDNVMTYLNVINDRFGKNE